MHQPQPFLGICGTCKAGEYADLLKISKHIAATSNRFLMVGLKQVKPGVIAPGMWTSLRPFMHCTLTPDEPFEQLVNRTITLSRPFVRGLQLNMLPWIQTDYAPLWRTLKKRYPNILLVLQAHAPIMQDFTPRQIAQRLQGSLVDYILFDSSQSRGRAYDSTDMRRYVDAIYKARLPLGVVVAGGLDASNMLDIFQPLAAEYPNLSCDAFKRLNDPSTATFSWPAVNAYVDAWKKSITMEAT